MVLCGKEAEGNFMGFMPAVRDLPLLLLKVEASPNRRIQSSRTSYSLNICVVYHFGECHRANACLIKILRIAGSVDQVVVASSQLAMLSDSQCHRSNVYSHFKFTLQLVLCFVITNQNMKFTL